MPSSELSASMILADFISIDGIPRNINYPIFVNRDKLSLFDERLEDKFKDACDKILNHK